MDGDSEGGAKASKLCPVREMTKSILQVGQDQWVYNKNLLDIATRSLIL